MTTGKTKNAPKPASKVVKASMQTYSVSVTGMGKAATITKRSSSGEPVLYTANVLGKPRLSTARKTSMAKAMLKHA
jgi:hypothetical protein